MIEQMDFQPKLSKQIAASLESSGAYMKLTLYQKKIIDKIISGEVCDIPSYLRVFSKGAEQQYNVANIQATFDEYENGATYVFREEKGHTFFTDLYDYTGAVCHTIPVSNRTTMELHDNPISIPVKAELDMQIPPEAVSFGNKTFKIDFLKNKHLIANSFMDIRDFVALWSYLRREALVFEGSKQITEEDLSIFFELVDQEIQPQLSPHWQRTFDIISSTEDDPLPKGNFRMVPQKKATNYLKQAWKLNNDEFAMYSEYIGVKMMATSELKNYQQSGYRTVEEKSQSRNLFAAWAAVIISLFSVFVGNILPLFQKTDVDYLNGISQQITSIEQKIDADTPGQDIYLELTEIHEELTELSNQLEHEPIADLIPGIKTLVSKVEELNCLLYDKLSE